MKKLYMFLYRTIVLIGFGFGIEKMGGNDFFSVPLSYTMTILIFSFVLSAVFSGLDNLMEGK